MSDKNIFRYKYCKDDKIIGILNMDYICTAYNVDEVKFKEDIDEEFIDKQNLIVKER